jgi:hypothetical protein
MKIIIIISVLLSCSFLGYRGFSQTQREQFIIVHDATDSTDLQVLNQQMLKAVEHTEDFFSNPFSNSFVVNVYSSRQRMDEQWRKDWSEPSFTSECWMVASGIATKLDMLSPVKWETEACEHSASDTARVQRLVTHEVVHVYHGQQNPSPDFSNTRGIDWFVEGLATYVSGQLDQKRMDDVLSLKKDGKMPAILDDFWKGKYKYGLAGSIVKYIDEVYGRDTLSKLLSKTSKEEVLHTLNTSEKDLLKKFNDTLVQK